MNAPTTNNVHSIELDIDGMTCSHCKHAVEQALNQVPGVDWIRVDLQHGRATVQGKVPTAALISAVENEGYRARAVPTSKQHA